MHINVINDSICCWYNQCIRKLNTNEDEAKAFLQEYNTQYGALLNAYVKASWNYETNLTDENAYQVVSVLIMYSVYTCILVCIYVNKHSDCYASNCK